MAAGGMAGTLADLSSETCRMVAGEVPESQFIYMEWSKLGVEWSFLAGERRADFEEYPKSENVPPYPILCLADPQAQVPPQES